MMKDRQFVWEKAQQDSFEEIKCRLIKPPVLHISTQLVDFIYIQIQANL